MKKSIYCILVIVLNYSPCFSQDIDYDKYRLVFEDQFNYSSPADPAMMAKWSYGPTDEDWSGGIEWLPKDDATQLNIIIDDLDNHYLRISAERMTHPVPMPHTAHPLRYYWSGMIVSKTGNDPAACVLHGIPQNGYKYGLFEMRAKLPKGDPVGWDAWPAFWMKSMGAEIDIIDDITNDPGRLLISGFIDWWRNPQFDSDPKILSYRWDVVTTDTDVAPYYNYQSYHKGDRVNYVFGHGSKQTYEANGDYPATMFVNRREFAEEDDLSEDFHLYAVEWTADSLIFFLDGKLLHANAFSPPFIQSYECAMKILVNLSVMGTDGKINPNSDDKMDMDIDYIRVWKRKQ